MTAKPNPPRARLPKAHVRFCDGIGNVTNNREFHVHPVAVIPCRTLKEARAICRLHSMSREQLYTLCEKAHFKKTGASYSEGIHAILDALNLRTP